MLVAAAGLKPEQGEILDIFYYPLDQLRDMAYHDPRQVPEWTSCIGQPPTPEQRTWPLRNREMSARLIWKPYTHNPRLPHFLPRVTNPTLIVWGRQDRIVPVDLRRAVPRLLPNATLKCSTAAATRRTIEQPDE